MKVQTYLPLFGGFYGGYYEADNEVEQEIEIINEQRAENGLKPIAYDDCNFDFPGYYDRISKGITNYIEQELIDLGIVKSVSFERLRSPREYNFANDVIDVEIELTADNQKCILAYLKEYNTEFAKFIKDSYTSYSGFCSYYPNTVDEYMTDKPLNHSHKLGSILNFILRNEGKEEIDVYYNVQSHLDCTNYEELLTMRTEADGEPTEEPEPIDPNQLPLF